MGKGLRGGRISQKGGKERGQRGATVKKRETREQGIKMSI